MISLAGGRLAALPHCKPFACTMVVLPKSLIRLGAGFLAARTARRWRDPSADLRAQEHSRRALGEAFGRTAFGRDHGIDGSTGYTAFCRKVPLRGYEQFAPYLARMERGEPDVLAPGRCRHFAASSGTTTGQPKRLPVNEAMIAHFRLAARNALLWYVVRTGHRHLLDGRFLFLGSSGTLVPFDTGVSGSALGHLGGIVAANLPAWAERHYYEPGSAVARISDWSDRLEAIVARTRALDIRLVAGIPSWLLVLAERLMDGAPANGSRSANLQAIWRNLECVVHGGAPLGPFADALRTVIGPRARFHEVYPSAEGFIAAQDTDGGPGLRLLADAGLFFEFLPMEVFDEKRLELLGTRTVPLEGVRAGVDYALVLTTPGGLTRYVLGDIVRFVSTQPARLLHMGRTRLQLNAFGERLAEKTLTDVLLAVCRRHNWTIVNFHVAPLPANAVTGQGRGRHEWWVELRPMTAETPTGPIMAVELDAELQRAHDDYAARRRSGAIEAPFVRLVMPGVFDEWMQQNDRWGGQDKMPRCRSDRAIADPLARIARFSAD